jgi:hypothetical protein
VPLLCVFAGIGLDTVVAKLSARASSLALASSAAALVLPLGLGWFTIASGSVIRDGETVVFHNAREIADFLRTRMVHDERLVMARAGSVYDYYLRQSGHRLREYMGPQRTGALLVVVGNVSPHTPDQDPTYVIAHRPQIQASAYGPPVLIRKFPEIDIFEMPSLIQPTR